MRGLRPRHGKRERRFIPYLRTIGREPTDTKGPAISLRRKSFEKIVEQYYGDLWSYVSFLTGGSADGEDILHQAFLLAFDRLAEGDTGERRIANPGKWLRGTIRNLVHAWWRQKRKLPRDLADQLEQLAAQADDATTAAVKAEMEAALEHCLGMLSQTAQRLVSARYDEGLRITQIAEQMNLNAATARVRLFRIRTGLKTCVETVLSEEVVS